MDVERHVLNVLRRALLRVSVASAAIGLVGACAAIAGIDQPRDRPGVEAGVTDGSIVDAPDEHSGGDSGLDSSNAADTGLSGDSSTVEPPSCQPGGAGMTNCGATSESCCVSLEVTGGTYYRTYTNNGDGGTGESDLATVSGFRLDKYLVTVGRFRQFVMAWNSGTGWTPAAGDGRHSHLSGGLGLANSGSPGSYEPGWVASDHSYVAPTTANLACPGGTAPNEATWTATAGSNEQLPINCLNWYEAYAFCIWDGGFLPSEAEWEYAAAGGSEQREYPWGSTAPGTSNQYAIYGCYYPNGSGSCTGVANIAPVGAATLGVGLWGQLDLGGEVTGWNLDWAASYVDPCTDCAYLAAATGRIYRGGWYGGPASQSLATSRGSNDSPSGHYYDVGVRCARSP